VALLMEGLKNKGIAERLGIQEQVVKNHLQHIFDKTGCSTRVELRCILPIIRASR
jgi:DNA-binding NarL/FixJ family response regulator